ncbi:MAG: hemerythrin domain-containing protein [Acidimicrobiales bacterium]
MADVTKVMIDDHLRLKGLFGAFRPKQMIPWSGSYTLNLEMALGICDEVKTHLIIEEELVYTAAAEMQAGLVDDARDDNDVALEIVSRIEQMDPAEPALYATVMRLKRVIDRHVQVTEGRMFPLVHSLDRSQQLELGRRAFARRQELLHVLPDRATNPSQGIANSGW